MRKTALLGLLAVLPVMSFAAQKPPTPAPAARNAAPPAAVLAAPAVIDVEKARLTKDQFDKLPDSQVLEFKGKRTTVGVLRARLEVLPARRAAGKTTSAARMTTFQAFQQKFLADQKATIAARNAQVLADFERLNGWNVVAAPR